MANEPWMALRRSILELSSLGPPAGQCVLPQKSSAGQVETLSRGRLVVNTFCFNELNDHSSWKSDVWALSAFLWGEALNCINGYEWHEYKSILLQNLCSGWRALGGFSEMVFSYGLHIFALWLVQWILQIPLSCPTNVLKQFVPNWCFRWMHGSLIFDVVHGDSQRPVVKLLHLIR